MTKISKIIALTALIMTAFLLISVTQARAATMKFRVVFFHTKVEVIEVGDVEGHIVGIYKSTGLASLETGEVAVFEIFAGTIDYTKGTGIHDAYWRLTFEDGTTIDFKSEGTTRPDPKGKGSVFKSTSMVVTQGSGKYTGIQGTGSYTGRRVVPVVGAGAQLYMDIVLTYTLP
jgi:hypothetical protein